MGRRIGEAAGEQAEMEDFYARLVRAGIGRTRATRIDLDDEELEALHRRWNVGALVEDEATRIRTLPVAARIAAMERKLDELGLLAEARAVVGRSQRR